MTQSEFEQDPRRGSHGRSSEWARGEAGEETWRRRGRAALRWLARRPAESWGFFAAGVVIGGLLL